VVIDEALSSPKESARIGHLQENILLNAGSKQKKTGTEVPVKLNLSGEVEEMLCISCRRIRRVK
jgi:hypothetical protein